MNNSDHNNLKEKILEYLNREEQALAMDYVDFTGKNIASCTALAVDAARILIKEGKKPCLMYCSSKDIKDNNTGSLLCPLRYKDKISWRAHVACACNGYIYDPMLGQPILIETYPQIAFGVDIKMKQLVSETNMTDFIRRTHLDLFV